jgi:spore maturation protein CgeB
MKIVILGLSITSSWGNGHATTYRALVRSLVDRGHDVLFLERDVPWYAAHRDLPDPPMGRTRLYTGLTDLVQRFTDSVAEADLVIVGSFVPEGVAVGRWVVATARGITGFYDIDTPVTLAKLARGDHEYLHPDLIGRFDMYLSFTAGPTLREIEQRYGSPCALPLFCSVDVRDHHPLNLPVRWDLTYMGTYSADRQPGLERLLVGPAMRMSRGRFAVAGSLYPSEVRWPVNVMRIEHLPPRQHSAFYCRSRFTLNLTRDQAGLLAECPPL